MLKKYFLVFGFLAFQSVLLAQPCLTGWLYRTDITVNSGNVMILYNHQIKITVNTASLVSSGKARIDGGDIRFTNSAGSVLTFWYDPQTYNTTATDFWIKADQVNIGANAFYMFYGNSTSSNIANGDATFEFFDNFETGDFSPLKWQKCGNNANFSVVGALATMQSTNANQNGVAKTINNYANVVAEAKVTSATNGRGMVGLIDPNNNGYATVFESNPSGIMKMMAINNGGTCQTVTQLAVPAATAAGTISGIWGFTWPSPGNQTISWPSGTTNYTETANNAFHPNSKKLIIGSVLNQATSTGTITMDWVRLRKYAASEPSFTLGGEFESPVNPSPFNTGPYCGGETIELFSTAYAGAVYSWVGPNGFTSPLQNPTIPASVAGANDGIYSLTVSMPGGCNSTSLSTVVNISSASIGGSLSGNTTVCSGTNTGVVNLSGSNGSILRWEMSSSLGGPWINLANTTTSTSYENITNTTYYRAVVKNGSCAETFSSTAQITVTSPTVGGFILGAASGCDGNNSGSLTLAYQNGNIIKWESSTNNGSTWSDITNSSTTQSYLNLNTTTLYRAQVQSGVCPALYSDVAQITVYPNPVASFTSTNVCKGINTAFTNTSTGSISTYSWNFGNGSGSISQNPIYQYPQDGNYTVELSVTSPNGCSSSVTNLVQVFPLPVVGINHVDVCQSTPMNLQAVAFVPGGSIASYNWTLGDGNVSNVPNPAHLYAASGLYNVKLIITSNNACVDSAMVQVEVGAPASVSFIADSVCLGQSINFINTSSSSSSTVNYTWNFGNGATSVLFSPTYTYPAVGTYTVTLQAQVPGGTSGCIASTQRIVQIYENPVADFSFLNVCKVDSMSFNNLTTYSGGQSLLSYAWNFGDATISTLTHPKHLYASPTNYTVNMTATTSEGCFNSKSHVVTVHNMPIANFTQNNVCLNQLMNFTSTSSIPTGSITFDWNFGNGNVSSVQNPVHLYAADQDYSVRLIATSNFNCRDTMIKTVTVYPLPQVSYSVSPVCDGITTQFTNNTTINSGSIISNGWDFSDGSSSTAQHPTHLFLNVGNYNVILLATSNFGCVSSATQLVVVNPLPVANFSVLDACLGVNVNFSNTSTIQFGTLTHNWSFGDGASSTSTNATNNYSAAGFYPVKLVATSAEGCVDSIIKYAEVFPLPIANAGLDTAISQGFSIQLNGFYPNATSYSWTPDNVLDNGFIYNPKATPLETTTFQLTVTDQNGCSGSDAVVIEVIKDYRLFIHNVITPDGNGLNDTWKITNIETFESADVYVYDRWGKEVLAVKGYQNDWEGVSGTDQLPDGTYYYIILFSDTDKVYKGSLTILRNK
jgi:gliding motility-associated-like protein